MKVSIMITTYNCEECVDAAIESVISQDMPFDWELLVGDDGSSDQTLAHINNWIEKYPNNIKLYVMDRTNVEEKNGTRAARNRANLLEHAKGEYLNFLDGDDKFLGTEKLMRQVTLLDSNECKGCSCVAHNILANDISCNKKYPLTDSSLKDGIVDSQYYWKNLYFHTNTILFRRCCVEMLLNEKYRDYLNDNFITYIILQHGSIYYLHDIWGQYNLTGSGLWTGKKRTYGCFRNIILFDLEKEINWEYRLSSFIRHLYDFRYIFRNYDMEDRKKVCNLVSGLSDPQFHYTLLLYRKGEELSFKDKVEKILLRCQVWLLQGIRIIGRLDIYIKRMLKKV